MKRNYIDPNQLSIFDVVIEHAQTPITPPLSVPEAVNAKKQEKPLNDDTRSFCPYTVPTVDEIVKLIDRSAYSINRSKLISDTFECGALAISNLVDLPQCEEREQKYKTIMNSYKPKERELIVELFNRIYALLTSVTYDNGKFDDYLGDLFMRCNQGNKHTGQFFTPYHVSLFMAKTLLANIKDEENPDKIITLSDPCCGGGGMLMAALDVMKNDHNINYARNCFILAQDIDLRCVHMTYLQLALAGVPAIVCHQDTLTLQLWSVWKTPAYIFQYSRFHKYDRLTKKEQTA